MHHLGKAIDEVRKSECRGISGRRRGVLQAWEQGCAWTRRGIEQQDPHH